MRETPATGVRNMKNGLEMPRFRVFSPFPIGPTRAQPRDPGRHAHGRIPWLLLRLLAVAFLLAVVWPEAGSADPSPARARTPAQVPASGRIEGRVLDASTGKALAFANVVLVGTRRGTISQPDGSFLLEGVPAGESTIRISFIGFLDAQKNIKLRADGSAFVVFELEPTVARHLDVVQTRAERPLIDVHKTSTTHTLSAHDIASLVTQSPTIDNVVAQQPGVIRDRGRLHFRGGRADENLFLVDGVKVKDLLSGQSTGTEIDARAAQEVSVVTGGFGARYSQAMSGVVNVRLKEGSRRWHGALSYESDALVDTKNLHLIYTELSGPNLLAVPLLRLLGVDHPDVTFFSSLSCNLSDGYLPNIRGLPGNRKLTSSIEDQFLGMDFSYGDFLYPRASNRWHALFKTAWKATARDKFSLSWNKTVSFSQDWGSPDIGDIDRNVSRFPWSWAKRMDHHYTVTGDVNILSLIWNRTLGTNSRTNIRLWRHYSGEHRDVAGQMWNEYDISRDWQIEGGDPTPFFTDTGDASSWRDRYVIIWGLGNEWAYRLGRHDLEWGLSAEYQDVQYMRVNAHAVCDSDTCRPRMPLGDEYDLFHVTPNAGNLYLQDQFQHEGMIVAAGLAYDYWFPGAQVERALDEQTKPHMTPALRQAFYDGTHELFGHRFKGHFSPRIAVSFPTSDRAHLFFNYGHYSQLPKYYYVYSKSCSQSGEEYPLIGNPALNPEISVQYELGTEYQFSDMLATKITLFWKDMYDYPTSLRIQLREHATTRSNFFIYWNEDYARSRGIELSLLRQRRNFLRGSLSYTFSVAKGKSSDANKSKLIQELGGDSRETTLGEEFLWWNRPHKFTAHLNLQIKKNEDPPRWLGLPWPRDFGVNVYFKIRSGRAYTPTNAFGDEIGDPLSRNGPYDSTCDVTVTKGFTVGRHQLKASLKVYNLFNYRTPLVFDHATGKPFEFGKGSLHSMYDNPDNLRLSEKELAELYVKEINPDLDLAKMEDYEIAALVTGIRRTIVARYYSYSNPAYFGQPRTIRLGISYAW
jgi:outer membrane receptor protein involved in Fe transport